MPTVLESDLDENLERLADQMMISFEANAKDDFRALFAPGGTVWLSYMEGAMPIEQNADLLAELYAGFVRSMHYDDIRRRRTADGYVQQHTLTLVSKSGSTLTASACSVVHTNAEGLIVLVEEYVDSKIVKFSADELAAAAAVTPPSAQWSAGIVGGS